MRFVKFCYRNPEDIPARWTLVHLQCRFCTSTLAQNLNILVPPCDPSADLGYIIAEQNKIYPLFSGHNTICVATAVLEAGLVPMQEPETRLCLEAPGGLIQVFEGLGLLSDFS